MDDRIFGHAAELGFYFLFALFPTLLCASSILGLAPTSGAVLWQYPFVTDFNCNIATPLAVKEQVFVSSGENHGSVLLALKPNQGTFDV